VLTEPWKREERRCRVVDGGVQAAGVAELAVRVRDRSSGLLSPPNRRAGEL